jgi:hypothetical protein
MVQNSLYRLVEHLWAPVDLVATIVLNGRHQKLSSHKAFALHEALALASSVSSFPVLPYMVSLDSQRHYEIYCHSMMFLGHGYAPWVPEPDDLDPDQEGVDICDVLLLKEDGDYQYIFNCSLPGDNPKNMGRVPLPFHHFPVHPMSLTLNSAFHDCGIISSSETIAKIPSSPATKTGTIPIPYVCLRS